MLLLFNLNLINHISNCFNHTQNDMWTLSLGTISNADPDSGVEANMYFDVDFNAYATNSKVSDNNLKITKSNEEIFSSLQGLVAYYSLLWWVTHPDARQVN